MLELYRKLSLLQQCNNLSYKYFFSYFNLLISLATHHAKLII
jgi:hypothetical protein